jgi:hypothetical protein
MFYSSSNLVEKSSYILEEITNKPTIDLRGHVDDNVFVAIEPMRRDSAALTTEELVSKPICFSFFCRIYSFFFLSLAEKKNRKKLL